MNLLHEIAHSIFSWIVKVTMYDAKINLYNLDVLILSFFCHKYLIPSSSTRNSLKQTLRIGILLVLLSTDIQDLLLSKRRKYYVQCMRKHLWTIRSRIITILSLTFTVPDLSESSPLLHIILRNHKYARCRYIWICQFCQLSNFMSQFQQVILKEISIL